MERDPERIERILALVREAWRLAPDFRLGQLLLCATELGEHCPRLFVLDDGRMERDLQFLVDSLAASRTPPADA